MPPGETVLKIVVMSGFIRPSVVGPRDAPPMDSRLFHDATPDTPRLFFAVAGLPTVGFGGLFPFETKMRASGLSHTNRSSMLASSV